MLRMRRHVCVRRRRVVRHRDIRRRYGWTVLLCPAFLYWCLYWCWLLGVMLIIHSRTVLFRDWIVTPMKKRQRTLYR